MYKVTNHFKHGNKVTRLIHHTKRMICMPIGELLAPFVSLLTVSSTFDLLFKVLFTFPSLYFFAIGLPKMFSFRWDLPPVLGCNPKQPDSSIGWHVMKQYLDHGRDSHPLWCLIPKNLYPNTASVTADRKTTIQVTSALRHKIPRFKIWAMSASLAVTEDILVSFFSSA